jgi:poly(A) polymerase
MTQASIDVPTDLVRLREAFLSHDRDIRFVGGCVRDALIGLRPKDFDLATDATVEEQKAIYDAAGIRHISTGEQHGTLTASLGSGAYEITTLRIDRDHDGRHATVEFTRDWEEDLARRDLTINALALTFDGKILDPFGGRADLREKRVRFVGDPEQRIEEDYLRIMRFLRFHGRISPDQPLDRPAVAAILKHGHKLETISVERIWSGTSKILTGPGALPMSEVVETLGLRSPMRVPATGPSELGGLIKAGSTDSVNRMCAYLGYDRAAVADLAKTWRWSTDERDRAAFITENRSSSSGLATYKRHLAVGKIAPDRVIELALADGRPSDANALREWPVPRMPLNGDDLIRLGHRPGK